LLRGHRYAIKSLDKEKLHGYTVYVDEETPDNAFNPRRGGYACRALITVSRLSSRRQL
jgi:hypothetical protein